MKFTILLFITAMVISACSAPTATPPSPTPSASVVSTDSPMPATTPTSTSTPASSDSIHLEPFGTVNIDAADIKFNDNGSGSNVDSMAFWDAPDPADSLLIVTSKGNESIEVYKYPFSTETTTIACGKESNGIWVDQERDILYITERNSSNVCAFDLPSLQKNDALSFTTAATGNNSEPNLGLLSLTGRQKRIYISYDDQVFIHDAETGKGIGEFNPSKGLETMYGDDFYQVLYIPDENGRSGVYIYDPDGNPADAKFGDSSIFDADEEGIIVYKCLPDGMTDNGEGLIVVSDQIDALTDFEVFNRKTKEYLGTVNISSVNNTDGIASTQQASPDYPMGVFTALDDDTSTVGVGWDTIFEKAGLSCGK